MLHIRKWLKHNRLDLFFGLTLLLIVVILGFKNHSSNTYLTGWDNLHSEFDFKLNIERSLNAAWQEYQGVGLMGGMAHAADLIRQIILWTLSVFVPIHLVRYFWTFAMLFAGSWGVYFLLKDKSRFGGLAASVFYLFNLATVQYFFVPFETFSGFFGFLPWLIYFATKYLETRKGLLAYFIISVLATSAFYVQTLFVVYAVFLFVLSLGYLLKNKFKGIQNIIKLALVTLFVNAFWLLPVAWFSITSGDVPSNSDINRIATPETVYMNQARNDWKNIITGRGYWFDYFDFQVKNNTEKGGEFSYLFAPWIEHAKNIWVERAGIGLFVVAVVGLLISGKFAWLALLLIGYLMLAGFTPPTSVLQEAFRNSFTKWSVAFAFITSVGIGYFVTKFKKLSFLAAIIVICLSIYSVWPVFEGKLLSERVKVNIPNAYFESFNWLNTKSNGGRIAFFPAFDKWGWNYHEWGHGGSGFIWYGIENPILDRAFNVWSPYNESFYDEITNSINNNDKAGFKRVIEKYQISYLYLDESIIFPWGEKSLLKLDRVKKFSEELGYSRVDKFDFLEVIKTNIEVVNSISAINDYSYIDVNLKYSPNDPVFEKYGNYANAVESKGYGPILNLPFVNFDLRGDIVIQEADNQLHFINKTKNTTASVAITEKITENFDPSQGYAEANNCELNKNGNTQRHILKGLSGNIVGREYTATNGGIACDYFVYPQVLYDRGYVLKVKGVNSDGRGLKLYLYNWLTQRVELEELLPQGEFESYFVIYPKHSLIYDNPEIVGGYTLNLETRSFGKVSSQNTIEAIEFIPFDIDTITNIHIDTEVSSDNNNLFVGNLEILNSSKWGTSLYKVESQGSGILQLGQGYEDGWLAYAKTDAGTKKLKHFKVNGWSNGWEINDADTIYIVFWPQFLEWGGLLVLLLTGMYLIVKSRQST